MRIGEQFIEPVAFNPPGAVYPWPGESSDPWFQHVSLVAPEMGAAFAAEGWRPISRRGPVELSQTLMASLGVSGGFVVYKFRDPDGHPLEFPKATRAASPWTAPSPGLLDFDHSAFGVSDVDRSTGFYRDELGLTPVVLARSTGAELSSADGLANLEVGPKLDPEDAFAKSSKFRSHLRYRRCNQHSPEKASLEKRKVAWLPF